VIILLESLRRHIGFFFPSFLFLRSFGSALDLKTTVQRRRKKDEKRKYSCLRIIFDCVSYAARYRGAAWRKRVHRHNDKFSGVMINLDDRQTAKTKHTIMARCFDEREGGGGGGGIDTLPHPVLTPSPC